MKKGIYLIMACIIFVSGYAFGGDWGSCRNCAINTCTQPCCPYDTPCQCTDPGAQWNDCIDRCTYCQAFGNIGAR